MAFVLSGGGNLGALQVGMLRALLEHGVRPDLVIGCSVGAINGAGFADDPTLDHVDELSRLWIALDGQDLLPSGWSNAVSLARRGEAIHDHEGLRRMAHEALRSRTFEDLSLPFECVATDVAGAEEVWFGSGPLIEPILASSALPAIYPAVEIDGVRYLDGGIVNDVPMSRAVELGAATIYILQVGAFMRERPEPRRPLDVALQAYWVARHHRFKRELGALPPDVAVHVLPTGETPRMRFNDFTHSATLITRAYEASSAYLADVTAGRPPGSTSRLHRAAVTTLGEAFGEPEPAGLFRRAVTRRTATGPVPSSGTDPAPAEPGAAATDPQAPAVPEADAPGPLRRVVGRRNGAGPGAEPAPSLAGRDDPADADAPPTDDADPGVLRRAVTRRNGNGTDPQPPAGPDTDTRGSRRRGTARSNGRSDGAEPDGSADGEAAPTEVPPPGVLRRVATRRNGNGNGKDPEPQPTPATPEYDNPAEADAPPSDDDAAPGVLRRVVRRNGRTGEAAAESPADREGNADGPGQAAAPTHALRRVVRRNGRTGGHTSDTAAGEPDAGLYIPAGGEDGDADEPAGVRRWARATRLRRSGERPAAPARQTGQR